MNNILTVEEANLAAQQELARKALSRRTFLQGSTAGAAMGTIAITGRASAQSGTVPKLRDDLRVLVNRVSQGYTPELWQEASTRGFQGFLEWQLAYENIDDLTVDALLTQLPSLEWTPRQIIDNYGDNAFNALNELRLAALIRSYLSSRQLYDRMVEFWTDHLNIYGLKEGMWYFLNQDQREVIRKHALGNFRDMLFASAHSGAMLYYLDNYISFNGAINENYAREIMELHTLSVTGPYNEFDVKEVARCFTAWSIHFPFYGPNYGQFRYYPFLHDGGQKQVLGQTIPAGGGVFDGFTVIDMLAYHPATANFLAKKMSAWLLGEDPPQSVVDRVAAAYLATNGDIKSMIREILSPTSFQDADVYNKPKFQRPWRFVMSLLRATNPNIYDGFGLLYELERMGHGPYYWPAPDGYPDKISRWGSNVFDRWSFATRLFDNQLYGANYTNQQIGAMFTGASQGEFAQRASEILSGGTIPQSELSEIQAYINSQTSTVALRREALALVASTPSFQFF